MKRILIGSCGGLVGFYLSKLFSTLQKNIELWGMDAESSFASARFLDCFSVCPKASDKITFIKFLTKFMIDNKIDYYLPTHSTETRTVSEFEDVIRSKCSTRFIVSPFPTYEALDSKKKCSESLSRIGLYVPKIYQNTDEVIFPAFAKPESGSGSKGTYIINNMEELAFYRRCHPDILIMEKLCGEEYTVDAVYGNEGELITYNQRLRIKQQGGATVYTRNCFSVDIGGDLINISRHYKCKGVINIQFFLDKKSEQPIKYTDVNLRYASGGLPLSVESGIKLVPLLLDILDGNPVDSSMYHSDRKNRAMYRYYEEGFVLL